MIEQVDTEINKLVKEINYEELNKHLSLLMGGKRLRAKLILTIAKNNLHAPLLGAIVEMIHSASLLHDDVIDEATIRRGKSSINATQGSKKAIMLGDILYAKAFSSLTFFSHDIAYALSSAVTLLSVGEMMDVELAKSFNDNEQKYLDMLYLKTASLIEASASAAALLADQDKEMYGLYGKNLGLSFQIIDDILDITSDEKTLGKPVMSDFREGKCTLPYIYLYQSLNDKEKAYLKSLHAKELTRDESMWILNAMKKHNSIKRSFELAKRLTKEAAEAVFDNAELIAILDKMIQRSY